MSPSHRSINISLQDVQQLLAKSQVKYNINRSFQHNFGIKEQKIISNKIVKLLANGDIAESQHEPEVWNTYDDFCM